MDIIYNKSLLPKLEATQYLLKDVKCIMIQSTGINNDTAASFYDNISVQTYKKFAHFVIDRTSVVQYDYLDSSVFVEETTFTDKAIDLLVNASVAGDSPAFHTLVIEICLNMDDYNPIELNVIKFIAQFLKTHSLTTDNVWRREDIITDISNNNPQYTSKANWDAFIATLKLALDELKKPEPNLDSIPATNATYSYPLPPFDQDSRSITSLSIIDITTLAVEDYEITSQGDIFTKKDKFTWQITSTGGTTVFEPVYPDLTVPPRSTTKLYNEQVKDIRKMRNKKKPILGKPVNNQDPYPIDDKITELELHYPIVNIDDTVLNEIRSSTDSMAAYMVSMSQRAEKRIVQLENTMATMMRYMFRMGSRVNINCVYYGGQSVYGKYNCIRCLSDDLINDGSIVTIDQCLNCSRYEPILGQVYDILNEEMKLDLAPILDDVQAARTTMEDYIKLTRIEEMFEEEEDAICDTDELSKKDPEEKTLNELAQKNEGFIMDWTETTIPQMPDINEYDYNRKKIIEEKKARLKSDKKYTDGYNDVKKKKITLTNNSYSVSSSSGGGSSSGSGSTTFSGYFVIDDYDWTDATDRKAIVDTAIEFANMGKQAKAKYVFGGKIKDAYMKKTLNEIYDLIIGGTEVCTKTGDNDNHTPIQKDAISIDCSGFSRYCYKHNGIDLASGSQCQLDSLKLVGTAGDYESNIMNAIPGDLIFYGASVNEITHVTVYIGGEEQCEASTSTAAADKQVLRSKIKQTHFAGIGRLSSLALPKLKNIKYYNIDMTIDQAAQLQLKKGATGDGGGDHDPTNVTEIAEYLNPQNYINDKYKYQYFNINASNGLTVDQVKAILKDHNAEQELIDNADAYIEAAKKYGISEVYLVAHSGLESGWGSSKLASGKMKGPSTGRPIYNLYGIAAYNSDNDRLKARKYSEDNGWFTTRDGIIGGAKFVSDNYAGAGQNTIYKMRWNFPDCTHQYATDIGWAVKQTGTIADTLESFSDDVKSKYMFDIPLFQS